MTFTATFAKNTNKLIDPFSASLYPSVPENIMAMDAIGLADGILEYGTNVGLSWGQVNWTDSL
jgi:hypothetical protein